MILRINGVRQPLSDTQAEAQLTDVSLAQDIWKSGPEEAVAAVFDFIANLFN